MRNHVSRTLIAGLASTHAICASPTVVTRLVAATGDAVPGAEPGVTLGFLTAPLNHSLMTPTINDQDLVSFAAILLGPPVTISNQNAFFAESNAALTLRVRDEQASPIPNIPIDELQNIDRVPITPDFTSQSTLFAATLDDPLLAPIDRPALFRHTPSQGTQLIARNTQQAPGVPQGVTFSNISGSQQNVLLSFIAHATLQGAGVSSSNNDAIFIHDADLHPLIREADPAPLLPALTISRPASSLSPFPNVRLNDENDVLVHTGLSGAGVSTSNDELIYLYASGAPSIVVREGDPAPGVPSGVFGGSASMTTFGAPSLSNDGRVAFVARVGSLISNLFSDRSGALAPIALQNDPAPGFPAGTRFFAFSAPILNAEHNVAFVAFATTGSSIDVRQGLYLDNGSALLPLLVAGQPAPDANPGDHVHTPTPFAARALNDNSRIAAVVSIASGAAVRDTLYLTDHQLNFRRVVAVGDTISVTGADRTVIRIVPGRFNHNNALVYRLDFTDDSSAIFVSRLTIPGDANHDDVVNFADLNLVLSSFGATGIALPGDVNLDNAVGFADLNLVLSHFGEAD